MTLGNGFRLCYEKREIRTYCDVSNDRREIQLGKKREICSVGLTKCISVGQATGIQDWLENLI